MDPLPFHVRAWQDDPEPHEGSSPDDWLAQDHEDRQNGGVEPESDPHDRAEDDRSLGSSGDDESSYDRHGAGDVWSEC